MKLSRRSLIRAGMVIGAAAILGDSHWIEPKFLRMTRHHVPIRNAPCGWECKILHFADMHYDTDMPLGFLREAAALGLSSNPDLIAITGDFVHRRFPERQEFSRFLREIASCKPTFATMGNHDGGAWTINYGGYHDSSLVRTLVEDCGVTVLHNRSEVVNIRGFPLRLVGLGDPWSKELDVVPAFSKATTNEAIVLLSHNPDTKSVVTNHPWELMLSGHTHGGEVRIPALGATPFVPVKDKRFISGLYQWNNRWLHVTQGIATTSGLRFNCRPEVSILNLIAS